MQKQTIAIVEDEVIIANDIRRSLLNFGYSVYGIYTSGKSLLLDLQTSIPDLILLDINLGQEMSGIELSGIISQRYNIPIIFVTAFSDSQTVKSAIKNSPYGYILKPFTDETLFTTINVVFSRVKLENELRTSKNRYKNLNDLLPLSVFELDQDGNILFFNKYALNYFQDGNQLPENNKLTNYISDKNRFETFIKTLNGKGEIQIRVIDKDGVEKESIIIVDEEKNDRERRFRGVIIDFANMIKLQKQEIQLEKLNATAHIISKFNSELSVYLLNSLDLLNSVINADSYESADIKIIETNIKNAFELITSLDIFISKKDLTPSFENVNDIVLDIAKTTMFSLRNRNIKFGCNCDRLLPEIFIDKNSLKYVIMFLSNIIIEKFENNGEIIFRSIFNDEIACIEIQFKGDFLISSVKKDISFELATKIMKMQNGNVEIYQEEFKNIIRIVLPII